MSGGEPDSISERVNALAQLEVGDGIEAALAHSFAVVSHCSLHFGVVQTKISAQRARSG
jgi:hypothetical protein